MNQRPAVSVIVPFLNAERYLGEAQVLDKGLACYRQHDTSMTHEAIARDDYYPNRRHASRIPFLQWLESYLEAEGVTDRICSTRWKRHLWSQRYPLQVCMVPRRFDIEKRR